MSEKRRFSQLSEAEQEARLEALRKGPTQLNPLLQSIVKMAIKIPVVREVAGIVITKGQFRPSPEELAEIRRKDELADVLCIAAQHHPDLHFSVSEVPFLVGATDINPHQSEIYESLSKTKPGRQLIERERRSRVRQILNDESLHSQNYTPRLDASRISYLVGEKGYQPPKKKD